MPSDGYGGPALSQPLSPLAAQWAWTHSLSLLQLLFILAVVWCSRYEVRGGHRRERNLSYNLVINYVGEFIGVQ